MALIKIINIAFSLVLIALVKSMVNYKILSNREKHNRFSNMKSRCGKAYQKKNPRYKGAFIWEGWLKYKTKTFFVWLDNNYYEVDEEQMDIDKDILQYGNKQYHPDLCLMVPHSINVFFENIEVGKTNITYNSKTGKYVVKITDGKNYIMALFGKEILLCLKREEIAKIEFCKMERAREKMESMNLSMLM